MVNSERLLSAILVFALVLASSVSAMKITEIMYDLPGADSKREWIEIYNDEPDPINLSGWKFYEAETNHGLILVSGSLILQPGEYAVIADNTNNFTADNPSFLGSLFDSSFSLSNTGETLALKQSSSASAAFEIIYSSSWGAAGNGNSLQINSGEWCEGNPTPGAENTCSSVQKPESRENNQTGSEEIANQSTALSPADQISGSAADCSGINVASISNYSKELYFGASSNLTLRFNASCYDYGSVKVLIYGDSSRVVVDNSGNKIKKYASCEEGLLFENLEEKDYSWEIPFKIYDNCDSSYEDGTYGVSIRACSPSWEKHYEEKFSVKLDGEGPSCHGGNFKFEDNGAAEDAEEIRVLDPELSKNEKIPVVAAAKDIAAGKSAKSNYKEIYNSKDKDVQKIATYLLGILFTLLIIYAIINSGNI